jgi:hypothetical protein
MKRNRKVYEVMAKRCGECLYSKSKIVPDGRKEELLADCSRNGVHFICHKASSVGWDVSCRGFHDANPKATMSGRMAIYLGLVVDITEEQLLGRGRGSPMENTNGSERFRRRRS